MVEQFLFNHPWVAALLWGILYTSDYYLTLWGARLHSKQQFFRIVGSFELTPEFQEDVDQQRRFSMNHIMWLVWGVVILMMPAYLPDGWPYFYGFLVGLAIFTELVVHLRHVANILEFRRLIGPNLGVQGSIIYSREWLYRRSATNLIGMGVFTLIMFAITNSPILLGGAVGAVWIGFDHLSLARKSRISPTPETG